jgi:hypothetical protein
VGQTRSPSVLPTQLPALSNIARTLLILSSIVEEILRKENSLRKRCKLLLHKLVVARRRTKVLSANSMRMKTSYSTDEEYSLLGCNDVSEEHVDCFYWFLA